MLALAACCTGCGLLENNNSGFRLPVPTSSSGVMPKTIDPSQQLARTALVDQMVDKRVLFIGEVHDSVEHHENQLRIIKSMYARYPDFAIGVEYFQQPFQPFLDDYVAGRIDEKEMLKKTEYYKRWKIDYRMLRPIFQFARENHIPILALNVPEELHNKVFKGGMKALSPQELAQTPTEIKPANANYMQRLKSIFDSHPPAASFDYFVDGVLLWDEGMADAAVRFLNERPQSRMVVLAGLVHVLYGDGIPERVNRRLGASQSIVTVNGADFGQFANIADYALTTESSKESKELPRTGKLGITLVDDIASMYVSYFAPSSPAKMAGLELGDHIISLDGEPVTNLAELKTVMFDKQPSDHVQVTVRRDSLKTMDKELRFVVQLN
ncbi:MAG: PDZ domain-containing protein [Gallionella sp.]|nr:PDZ domain-containing protein [Gallionella sp.]